MEFFFSKINLSLQFHITQHAVQRVSKSGRDNFLRANSKASMKLMCYGSLRSFQNGVCCQTAYTNEHLQNRWLHISASLTHNAQEKELKIFLSKSLVCVGSASLLSLHINVLIFCGIIEDQIPLQKDCN